MSDTITYTYSLSAVRTLDDLEAFVGELRRMKVPGKANLKISHQVPHAEIVWTEKASSSK